ncbi:hypothetical protein OQA88_9603 [Cercophora sp. LCS_1]
MAAQWPPRSPHEALLGTPSGRERLRRLADRGSPTPSPSKLRTSKSTSALSSKYALDDPLLDDDDDDEEDEETLRLKLQAIEAKLKLKKLRAKKAATSSSDAGNSALRPEPAPRDDGRLKELPIQAKIAAARDRMESIERGGQSSIQVPASPVRRAQNTTNVQTSPQRILLGIDKGRRAADMSLKRAPSVKKSQEDGQVQQGGYLRRTKTPLPGQGQEPEARPMSFNERLASARTEEASRQERQQRIQKIRSTAFSVGRQEMEDYKTRALDIAEEPYKPPEYSRGDILASTAGQIPRSHTASSTGQSKPSTTDPFTADTSATSNGTESEAGFEPYSGLHLSKRILPHKVLTRAITGMKTYVLKDLLRHVKAPDWSLPHVESDIVVFAIIASKSDPRSHRPAPGAEGKPQKDRGKYMVITLVDLHFELELYLFNSGFDRFWKLTPGTILAILNPTIIPPPPGREATNRFGLVINSDADTILEIGNARDLGSCKSVKRDGQPCGSWINARRTEYCEFHTNEALRKARGNRIELNNTSTFGSGGGKASNSRRNTGFGGKLDEDSKFGNLERAGNYDRSAHSTYFVSGTRSVDPEEGGMADRVEREEALKRRLIRQEKERDIAKKLSMTGGGAGKEYMKLRAEKKASAAAPKTKTALGSSVSSSAASTAVWGAVSSRLTNTSMSTMASDGAPRWDARALGLVGRRGGNVSLGPAKRKRPESSGSNSTVDGKGQSAPMGWGTALKDKLARMKEGERLDGNKVDASSSGGDRSPVRKKTRFVTEKGIREAGRESLGEPLSAAAKRGRQVVLDDDDDDDDLIIVK